MKRNLRQVLLVICAFVAICVFFSLQSSSAWSPFYGMSNVQGLLRLIAMADLVDFLGRPTSLELTRQRAVKDAFEHAWRGYREHCFGRDTLHPVTNTCEDDFGGYGATAIDSLSTAIMFGEEDIAREILEHVASLDFLNVTGGTKIQVFEVTIRHLAAMISAIDLLDGPFSAMVLDDELRRKLFNQTVILGNALACAFNTPTGLPHDWVDPLACSSDGTRTTTAGAGTVVLEFGRLSELTGDPRYAQIARRAESYLLDPKPAFGEPHPGLLGSYLNITDGQFLDQKGSWGAFSDSYYEYLLKAYIFDSTTYSYYLERWLAAAESTMEYIGSHPYGHPEWILLASWDGSETVRRMESLTWFAGGNFILAGITLHNQTLIDFGLSIADAAGAIYNMTTTGLGGEFVTWDTACEREGGEECDPNKSIQVSDGRFRLRPEVLETWYYAWRATRDTKYRDWSWSAFEALDKYCRTTSGFSAITDVNAFDGGEKADVEESFVMAEVMKYVYLTHLQDAGTPYHVQDSRTGRGNTWVYNTEAHPFRVAGKPV